MKSVKVFAKKHLLISNHQIQLKISQSEQKDKRDGLKWSNNFHLIQLGINIYQQQNYMGLCFSDETKIKDKRTMKPFDTLSSTSDSAIFGLVYGSAFKNLHNFQIIVNQIFQKIKQSNPQKKISSFRMVFRASDHSYKASSFHQFCQNKSHTLVVVQTTQNKIFGGYTACKWLKNTSYKYSEDEKTASFLFRVNEEKVQFFKIKKNENQKAIMNHEQNGPIFGEGHDLCISDYCDKRFSWNNIGKTYQSQFLYGSKQANMLLSGQQKHKITQYQVWEIVSQVYSL